MQSKWDRNLGSKYDCLATARVATTFLHLWERNVVATLAVARRVHRLSSYPLQTQVTHHYRPLAVARCVLHILYKRKSLTAIAPLRSPGSQAKLPSELAVGLYSSPI